MALHVLAALAYRRGETLTSATLAQSVGTNPAFLRALLGRLKGAGLIDVSLGKGGGARLARSPDRITLKDIYDAVDEGGGMPKHSCRVDSCAVARGMGKVLSSLENDLEQVVQDRLSSQTVQDVLQQVTS